MKVHELQEARANAVVAMRALSDLPTLKSATSRTTKTRSLPR